MLQFKRINNLLENFMVAKNAILIFLVGFSLLLTACGGDEGGGNGNRKTSVTPDLSGAREVAVGNRHSCAVLKTGKLHVLGGK